MHMKIYLIALLLAASLGAHADQIPEYPFVVVKGVGKISMPPEIAIIDLDVRAVSTDVAQAAKDLQSTSSTVFEHARRIHLSDADIVAHEVSKSQEYSNDRNQPREFSLRRSIRLRVADLTKVAGLSDQFLSMKGVDSVRVDFELRDRQSIDKALDTAAAVDAKRMATQAALPLDRKVGPVMAISPMAFEAIGTHFGFPLSRSSSNRSIPVAAPAPAQKQDNFRVPELLHFSKELYVIFRVE